MVLTQEQEAEMKEAFQLFAGFEGKEKIEATKLGVLFQSLGMTFSDEELAAKTEEIARDNVICLKDFLAFMDRKIQEDEENDEEELRQAFRVMDKDGTGFIDMNEIRHIMLDLGSKLEGGKHCYPDEEYAHRAHRAEKGDEVKGPQLINFEEFKKMMSFQ